MLSVPHRKHISLQYTAQTGNAVWGNSRCLVWEPRGTHRYTRWAVRTSQETPYVSATEPNRSILIGKTAAVYYENRMEHTDTPCEQSVPHRKQYVSATEPNRFMLFGETVAVYCENHAEHTYTPCQQSITHRKHITSPLQSPTGSCYLRKQSLFVVRTVRKTQIHPVSSLYLAGNTICLR
jgi:hypothetical protein